MQRHARRDHGFTIPDPLLTKEHDIPNACNRCHANRDAKWSLTVVEKWYGLRMERPSRRRARAVALAKEGNTNAIPNLLRIVREETVPLWRATGARLLERWSVEAAVKAALLERVGDADPLVRAQAAHALEPLVEAADASAIKSIEHLLRDPVRSVRVAAAWAQRGQLETNSPAGHDLLGFLEFNRDQPAGAFRYATFRMERGDDAAALRWLEQAVSWDRGSAPLRQALAICLSRNGRATDSVRELEIACQLAPREAEYRFQLALALNEVGRLRESVTALEEATKLDPQHPRAWYNLGLGYSALGREQPALDALLRAEALDAANPRVPYARATILARLGRIEEARQRAARALELAPAFRAASELLSQLSRAP